MPEGVHGLPRYEGVLRRRPSFPVVAFEEVRRALQNPWARFALMLAFAYSVVYLGSLWTLKQSRGDSVHTMENFLYFVNLLRWAALAIAAVMTGPSLLEDQRRGALELYFSRAVTKADYLAGKVLAVLGLTFISVFGPAMVYFAGSWVLFEKMPDRWAWVPLTAAAYAAIWALVVAGVGLGLSLVSRSSRAATLLLFGGVAVLDVIISNLLEAITRNDSVQVISPLSALGQQVGWLFGADLPYTFPFWWGLVTLGGLALVGWVLVAIRHPRLQGVD
ncbi:MAG TPA: ABC transporter permease subunit [Candidatus Thermoplasmatota archaeon]|nr:ABC transporter permease subunit [Candidatus Thermoplasmatota archaeon]